MRPGAIGLGVTGAFDRQAVKAYLSLAALDAEATRRNLTRSALVELLAREMLVRL